MTRKDSGHIPMTELIEVPLDGSSNAVEGENGVTAVRWPGPSGT